MIDGGKGENTPFYFCNLLKNRIDLTQIPFTERGSRLLVVRNDYSLAIRLAERWFKIDPRLSGYRNRQPIIENIQFCDANNVPLPLDSVETYPHLLVFTTSAGVFRLTFADAETLLFTLPESRCGMQFTVHVNQGQTDRRGGTLHMTGDIRRNISYTTDRHLYLNEINHHTINEILVRLGFEEGKQGVLLINITPRLGFNRYIPDAEEVLLEAGSHWEQWFKSAPYVEGLMQQQYYYAWWIMRAGLISTRFYTTREAMTPSKYFYVGIWQWDAYFHALAYRHIDKRLAQDQFRILLDHQPEDGMLPDAVHDEGLITHLNFPVDADVTKPPILGWAAWKLYTTHHDRAFLEETYDAITRCNTWWLEQNDPNGDGLCEYLHPYSSGLDDSPLWDEGMPVTSPDLNTYLYLQMEALSKIAKVLGFVTDSHLWLTKAHHLLTLMLQKMWNSQDGLFWPLRNGEPVRILTPFSLFPLLTGALPHEVSRALIRHLTDPTEFWTPYPVPTVAKSDPHYQPDQMWRGPTWINVNYLLIEGLFRSGYPELARQLRRSTLNLVNKNPDIVEYYHPETGEPCKNAARTFGWSAALFIDLVLQEIGIQPEMA